VQRAVFQQSIDVILLIMSIQSNFCRVTYFVLSQKIVKVWKKHRLRPILLRCSMNEWTLSTCLIEKMQNIFLLTEMVIQLLSISSNEGEGMKKGLNSIHNIMSRLQPHFSGLPLGLFEPLEKSLNCLFLWAFLSIKLNWDKEVW